MKRSLVVVASFVVLNAVGFVVYRGLYSPDATASSLLTSKHQAADNLSRDTAASQAKLATPAAQAVPPSPTSEPHDRAPALAAQPGVSEDTNSPTGDAAQPSHETGSQRTRLKQKAHSAPVKPVVIAKPAADDKPEPKPVAETKPAVETKPAAEAKPADKAKDKDKVLEMEANPYKRGE